MYKFVLPDIPREKVVCEEKDYKTAHLLKKAFVGAHGELNSAVKFICYFYELRNCQKSQEAEVMLLIAVDEMKHFKRLGGLMSRLGVDLVYIEYPPIDLCACKIFDYTYSHRKILAEGISTKLTAINCYEKITNKIVNDKARKELKKIVEEEKVHLIMLEELLEK